MSAVLGVQGGSGMLVVAVQQYAAPVAQADPAKDDT